MMTHGVKPYYQDDHVTIYHGDCREVLPGLADSSVGMVFTDPPYFRVKGDWWDRQWDTPELFVGWLGAISDQWRRVLAGNGSLYCFASPRMAARVEVELSLRFNILNRIRWVKEAGWHNKTEKEALRSYLSPWEEIIFAEQYGQDTEARGEYTAAEAQLRTSVFEPLRQKLADALAATGWTKAELNAAMGFAPHGMADSRYFGRSQWQLPTPEHYRRMQEITGGFPAEYEGLRAEYEGLRRPFNVSADVAHTDVWNFSTVQDYPGKHPCEKPSALIMHALSASHRPDLAPVLDCFMGSGTTLRAAKDLGRKAIGIEVDERYCEIAAKRMAQEVLAL
jgi:site-specific DNA-methyltransferase (adenine-specific)